MNTNSEGVITIVVANNEMRLELVREIPEGVDVLVAPDNPRYAVLMDLMGDQLRQGPIVRTGQAQVNQLVDCVTKGVPITEAVPDVEDLSCLDTQMSAEISTSEPNLLGELRLDLHTPDVYESMKVLSHISQIPLHHQLNQHPTRPGKQHRIPKRGYKFTGGFK